MRRRRRRLAVSGQALLESGQALLLGWSRQFVLVGHEVMRATFPKDKFDDS
jgi:hypothetical protein